MPVTNTANETVNVIVAARIAILTGQVPEDELSQWGAVIVEAAEEALSRRETSSDYYLNLVHEGGKFVLEIKTDDDEHLTPSNLGKLSLHPVEIAEGVNDDCYFFFKDEKGQTVGGILTAGGEMQSHSFRAAEQVKVMIGVAYERFQLAS